MTYRSEIAAVIAGCCLAMGGVRAEVVPAAAAAGPSTATASRSNATAPQQLVNQYPLGPQRLCCHGRTGLKGQAGRRPSARVAPARGRARSSGGSVRHAASGGLSAVLLIGFAVAMTLSIAGVTVVHRRHRLPAPVPEEGSRVPEGRRSRMPSEPIAARVSDELEYRRLDDAGDAGGAFNLGVVLHQRGDVAAAAAAYERADQRGDSDAGFNLGVLLYEAGDGDGAEAAWRRSAGRGHVRAAANLRFLSRRRGDARGDDLPGLQTPGLAEFEELSYRRADESGAASGAFNLGVVLHQRGDIAEAAAAYERAEQRGDPDAAFNLGVLLYEAGDLDGAEAAWVRSARHGNSRASENLGFLLRRRRRGLENAGVGRQTSDER
jgi:tetratricopeptide (TPR) repeat protein